MAHSAACSSSASQSSPTHRTIAGLPTSPCLSRFWNDLLETRTLCTVFSPKLVCFLDVVVRGCRNTPHARAQVIFYFQWPDHFWNAGAASAPCAHFNVRCFRTWIYVVMCSCMKSRWNMFHNFLVIPLIFCLIILLSLGQNGVTSTGAIALSRALLHNKSLEELK